MEANKLMIGDWVLMKPFPDSKPIPNQIVGIEYNSWQGEDYCDWVNCKEWDELSLKDIEPIPLTAEILEKNGFGEIKWNKFGEESGEGEPTNIFRCELETKCLMIKVEVGIYRPNFIIISASDDCGGEAEISNICKIDGSDIMLHELQHALRLCGIDKEIVL